MYCGQQGVKWVINADACLVVSCALRLLHLGGVALLVVLSDICSKLEHLIVCAAVCKGFTGGGVLLGSSVWAYLMGTTG